MSPKSSSLFTGPGLFKAPLIALALLAVFGCSDALLPLTGSTSSSTDTSSSGTDSTTASDGTDATTSSDATDGTEGTDGTDATTDSTDGTEGTDGTESSDGTEGTDGTESTDGTDGTDAADSSGAAHGSCTNAQIISAYPAEVVGSTTDLVDRFTVPTGDCTLGGWAGNSEDFVIKMEVEVGKRYTVRVVESGYQAGIFVMPYIDGCDEAPEPVDGTDSTDEPEDQVNCYAAALADGAGDPTQLSFTATRSKAWLVVDGATDATGLFNLTIDECDGSCDGACNSSGGCGSTNTTCDGAIELLLGVPVSATTEDGADNYRNEDENGDQLCTGTSSGLGGGAPDLTYKFDVEANVSYAFSVTSSDPFDSHLYVTSDCADLSDLTCNGADEPDASGETVVYQSDTATTVYVIVDGADAGDAGKFTVRVDLN